MTESLQTVRIHAVVEMPAAALQTIVDQVKNLAGQDEKGFYRVDTADKVGEMISRFLMERDFESYVKDSKNYIAE